MTNRSFSQDENNLIFRSKPPTQQIDNVESTDSSLRADMVPGSQAIPEEKNIFDKVKVRIFFGHLIGLMILVGSWYLFTGQGRLYLRRGLLGLMPNEPQATSPAPAASSPVPSATQIMQAANTATQTLQPTVTLTVNHVPSATHTPLINRASVTPTYFVQVTETPEPECREALTITLDDIGKNLCVQGTVVNIIQNEANFMVIFSGNQGKLYWVAYDLAWLKGEIGKCYQVDGSINQIGNSPVLVFNYNNLPMECP